MIFLIINIYGKSTTFGMIAAFWILIFGLAVIVSGIQVQSGQTETVVGDTTTIVLNYADASLPFSTISFVVGIFFIGVSMYMLLANGMARTT